MIEARQSPHAFAGALLPAAALERFLAKIAFEPNSGCWLWEGAWTKQRYGKFYFDGKLRLAHRVSYEHFNGPIPASLTLDHSCRVPPCVNPGHLEAVTNQVNLLRGIGPALTRARYVAQTHCKRGHPLSGDNLRIGSAGQRHCKACTLLAKRRYRARLAARVKINEQAPP